MENQEEKILIKSNSYVNLHCHSAESSIRDSILRREDLFAKSLENKVSHVCVSAHGSMSDWWKIYNDCKKYDLKYIPATEFYYAENAEDKGDNYHLMVYAKNQEGFKNLCRLHTYSWTKGFYKKNRIDKKILSEYKDGLIVSTACMVGLAARKLISGDIESCNKELDDLHSIFKEDFFLEIMNHNIPEEEIIRNHFRNYGRENNIRVLATNDCHLANRGADEKAHKLYKQLSYNSIGKDDDEFFGDGYWYYSLQDFQERFNQEEIDNTLELANRCNIEFDNNSYHLPKFDIPNKELDSYEYLKEIAWQGLVNKKLDKDPIYVKRFEYELEQIHLMGFEDYFLMIADCVNWANSNNIYTGPGRGSSSSSLINYCLGTTKIDPIKYGLIFERFLSAGRSKQFRFLED